MSSRAVSGLLSLGRGGADLGEEERVGLGGVGGVHRLQCIHRALEVAEEETGVALQVVEIRVVRIDLEPLIRYLERRLRVSRLEEVLEQLLAQLLVGRRDAQHLLERQERVGGVVRRLILGGQRGPDRQALRVSLGRRLKVLHDFWPRRLLRLGDLRQAVVSEAMVRHALDRLVGCVDRLVGLGGPLVDAGLGVLERLGRGLQCLGDAACRRPAGSHRHSGSA